LLKPMVGVLVGTLAVSWPASVLAQAVTPPLTFRAALELAMARNLDLAAARRGRAVREAQVRAAGQYPNPEFSFEATRDTPHETLSFGLPLEVNKRSRRIDLAREELTLADLDERSAVQALRRKVRLAFYGLVTADEGARLADDLLSVAERVRQVAQARYDEGAAPRMDVMAAELIVARARGDAELARSARSAASADVNALLNQPPGQVLSVAGDAAEAPPAPTVDRLMALAASANPDLLLAEREVAIEERRVSLLRAERLPTPLVSFGAVLDAPGEFNAGAFGGVSLTIPLFSRNQGEIAASLATIDQIRTRRDAIRRSVEAAVFGALARMEAWRKQVDSYRQTLVPTATALQSLAEESYRLGRNPVLAVLEAQRALRDLKREYLQALLDFQTAVADLEEVVGGPIE
jgi:cobalt-zinc-cadmium efflux system outer membrane protein